MNQEQQHGEIMQQLGKLEGLMIGMTQRQDFANGRTTKLEAKVESLEKSRDEARGLKMSWREILGWITGISGIVFGIWALLNGG